MPSSSKSTTSRTAWPDKSVYLFYHHYPPSRSRHSLYKIDLENNNNGDSTKTMCPLLEFPRADPYPSGMKCARLGSKLYILGGVQRRLLSLISQGQSSDYYAAFPRDVYMYDMLKDNTSTVPQRMEARLTTGKPNPCVFAVNGKLYVLGSIRFADIPRRLLFKMPYSVISSTRIFECYDPITDQWEPLDDPPVSRYTEWRGCTVLEERQEVVVLGSVHGRAGLVHLVYRPRIRKWTECETIPESLQVQDLTLSFQEAEHGRLYGLSYLGGPVKSKYSYVLSHEDATKLRRGQPVGDGEFVEMSIPGIPRDKWVKTFTYEPYVDTTSRFLRRLGNDHLCYITAGMLPSPHGYDDEGYLGPDEFNRGITITLLQEIIDPDDGNGSSSKSQGTNIFQAKILGSQKYIATTSLFNSVELVGCFVVSHAQLRKQIKNKKKNDKKMKKKNDELIKKENEELKHVA